MDVRAPLVRLQDISYHIGGVPVLQGITLDVSAGAHLALHGENGAGKSTLLRILTGEQWPDRNTGQRFFGFDGALKSSPLLARPYTRRVAPEQQERFLRLHHDVTTQEFILSGQFDTDYLDREISPAMRERCAELADDLQLTSFLARPARRLSHGTLRRALLARALMVQPALLVLDEALDGIDQRNREFAMAALARAVAAGTTMIWVAHTALEPSWITQRLHLQGGTLQGAAAGPGLFTATAPGADPPDAGLGGESIAPTESSAAPPLVSLHAVRVWRDEQSLLAPTTWEIKPGERWLLRGPNAAGKSTLAAVIAGSILPSEGSITYWGQAKRPSLWEIRRRIALCSDMLQTRYDWAIDIRDVVASGFSGGIGFAPQLDAAQTAHLTHLLSAFELDELAQRPFSLLSFGQRRRVLLARAFANEPRLLILDEFFEGLDARQAERLAELLRRHLHAGMALIVISHRSEQLALGFSGELALGTDQHSILTR
jgi:molybdate transport system ATP-binding protein